MWGTPGILFMPWQTLQVDLEALFNRGRTRSLYSPQLILLFNFIMGSEVTTQGNQFAPPDPVMLYTHG